jgi:hypothetical protein
MSDDDPNGNSFEDVARALAEEVTRALERISEIDVDEITRTASSWLREQAGNAATGAGFTRAPWDEPSPAAPPADDPLTHAGPSPLDLPTADQGLALAALDSGRWRIEPGTSTLGVHGEGPGPRDALGLVRELRVRD